MRLVRTPLFPRFFLWKKLRVRKGSAPKKRDLDKRGLITGPCKGATKHYENRYFWTMKTPGPIFERTAGPIIEPTKGKIRPHYRSLQHIYIYIYISLSLSLSSFLSFFLPSFIPSFLVFFPSFFIASVFIIFRSSFLRGFFSFVS